MLHSVGRRFSLPLFCLLLLILNIFSYQAAADEPLVSSGAKIAFMGDSITDQGWKHPAGYVRLIVDGLEKNGIHVTPIPAGVGGNIAHQMRDRLQRDVLDKKPDWLVLSCGINDVWHLAEHKEGFEDFRVLKTFGLTQEQVDRLHESWRDIPDAWELRANYDKGNGKMFLVRKLVTIRQYERMQQIAATKKQSAEELVGALHGDNIAALIKPRGEIDSYDAIFERKLQEGLQPKLQASFDSEVDRLLQKTPGE